MKIFELDLEIMIYDLYDFIGTQIYKFANLSTYSLNSLINVIGLIQLVMQDMMKSWGQHFDNGHIFMASQLMRPQLMQNLKSLSNFLRQMRFGKRVWIPAQMIFLSYSYQNMLQYHQI